MNERSEDKGGTDPSVDRIVTEASELDEGLIRCWCGAVGTVSELFDSGVYEQSCGGSGFLNCECGGDFACATTTVR